MIMTILNSCRNPYNYTDIDGPQYLCLDHDVPAETNEDMLTVVSYNIEEAKNIHLAINLLKGDEHLSTADVILLQEMDREGMKRLSDALKMNYIYFPINSSKNSSKDFGNGILTRNCINQYKKIILPHGQAHNNRLRSFTSATINYNGVEIQLVSAQLATVVMPSRKRKDQVKALRKYLDDSQDSLTISIVGGDFNAVTSDYRNFISTEMQKSNHAHSSKGLGSTIRKKIPFATPELDMIFSKNLQILSRGKVVNKKVSDHYPIWVKYKVK
ncbi:MAG: endonuclease/exonuclease/phosphatase family metal-dependent hydrolase [Saprospiraceae bacterium]|jgi:endonuclease/exonuclease/phosphatase family metal-dependent hydrolase